MSFVGTTFAVTSPLPENCIVVKSVSSAYVRAVGAVRSNAAGAGSSKYGNSNGWIVTR